MADKCSVDVPITGGGPSAKPSQNQVMQLDKLCKILEELQKPTPEGSNFAQVGCIYNAAGDNTGCVFASRNVDESTTPPTITMTYWAFIPGMLPIENYTGPWEKCRDENLCVPTDAIGVQSSWG